MSSHQIVDIDSDLRQEGRSDEFTYRINLNDSSYNRVSLLSVAIPKSMYLISATFGGNVFTLTEGLTSVTITIEEGNYTFRALSILLQTLLNNNSPNGWVYTVTTSNIKGKFTFSVSGNTSQPIISFPSSSSIYTVLGFDKETTNPFLGNTLTSRNVCMLTTGSILLKSDLVQSDWTSDISGNNLGSFSLSSTPNFGVYSWSCPDPIKYSRPLDNNSANSKWFWITDGNDQSISLNGLPLLFSLLFYKEDNTNDLIRKDIELRWIKENLKE